MALGRLESRGGGMILLQINYIDALQTYPNYPDDVYEIFTNLLLVIHVLCVVMYKYVFP